MALTIWRWCHLYLAWIASLFLIVASVTGVILSFSPVQNKLSDLHPGSIKGINLAVFLNSVKSNYFEILDIKVEETGFIKASVISESGDFETFYVDSSGQKIGEFHTSSSLLEFSRVLHRSLFLGTLGRVTMGVVAFLLFLISLSGCILFIKRQIHAGGIMSGIVSNDSNLFQHLWLGRISLPLLVIISITGTFLSLDRFELLPREKFQELTINSQAFHEDNSDPLLEFDIFNKVYLDEVESILFPFSPSKEDYFEIKLKDRTLLVNQFNGDIINESKYDWKEKLTRLSFDIHTAKNNIFLAILWFVASISILFFIYSGLKISLKRIREKTPIYSRDEEAEIVILYGSESGITRHYAVELANLLFALKEKVFVDQLNNYKHYPKAEELIIMSSTYGDGEAPLNANQFLKKLANLGLGKNISYAVVGFGSHAFKSFCGYAEIVVNAMHNQNPSGEILDLYKVNDQSHQHFVNWVKLFCETTDRNATIIIDAPKIQGSEFKIIDKIYNMDHQINSFLLNIKSLKSIDFESGDLFAISPSAKEPERLYSLAKISKNQILLSIRLHENGKCSNFLHSQLINSKVKGRIISNPRFHIPASSKPVIAISNGTGIAPFLGVKNENKASLILYWGGKSEQAFATYLPVLNKQKESGQILSIHPVYSADNNHESQYVQDELKKDKIRIIQLLNDGAFVMICGSLQMQQEVIKVLKAEITLHTILGYNQLESQGRILMDCY